MDLTDLRDGSWLLSPDKAAARIVDALLSDLPAERRAAVQEAIAEYAQEWGRQCSDDEARRYC